MKTCYSPNFSTSEEYTPLTSFKEGKTYRYSIALSKDYYSDFKFANSINLTVNGNKVILPCDENYAQETAIKTMTPKSDLTSIDDKDIVMTEDAINKGYRLSDNINLKLSGKVIASSNSKKIFDNEKFNKKIEFNNVEITLSEANIEPSKEDTDKPNTPGTVTPPTQDTNKPTKDNDGKGNPTSDATSIIGIFTMFTGLIGTATFKRKK